MSSVLLVYMHVSRLYYDMQSSNIYKSVQLHGKSLAVAVLNIHIYRSVSKYRYLKQMITQLKPDLLLLLESGSELNQPHSQQLLQRLLNIHSMIHIKANTRNQGLTLLCFNPAISLELQAESLDSSWFSTTFAWTNEVPNTQNGFSTATTGSNTGATNGGWLFCCHAPVASSPSVATWWQSLSNTIGHMVEDNDKLMILGDMNVHLTQLDKSTPVSASEHPQIAAVNSLLTTYSLVDVMRGLHPQDVIYTYHQPSGYAARLDYLFASPYWMDNAAASWVYTFPASDHNAVCYTFAEGVYHPMTAESSMRPIPAWVFHNQTLSSSIRSFIHDYFVNHPWSEEAPCIVKYSAWIQFKNDAAEYIRSLIQQYKHDCDNITSQAIANLKLSERDLSIHPSPATQLAYVEAKTALNHHLEEQYSKQSFLVKQRWYNNAERPQRAITSAIRAAECKRSLIPAVVTDDGTLQDDPAQMSLAFASFLGNIYTQRHCDSDKQDQFIRKLRTTLTQEQRSQLSAPFVIAELNSVKRTLPKNKVPGPDTLPYEFYTSVWAELRSYLLDIANTIATDATCPDDMCTSTIVMKYKQGDRCERTNYRPLSLLNTDYKIIAKLLAARTSRVLPTIIHADQHGFVKGRSIGDAIISLKLLEEYCIKENESMIAFMSDISKAYDTVDRRYLKKVLQAFGFPTSYLHCFDAFHTHTQARVLTNGALSDMFPIYSGVRQGCPWAPLLFIIMAETLAEAIRSDINIKGVTVHVPYHSTITNPQEYTAKFSAFADDTTTYMKDWRSYRYANKVFTDYGDASGNRINLAKSKCYLIGSASQQNAARLQTIAPELKLVFQNGFLLYLGVPFGTATEQFWQDKVTSLQVKLKRLQALGLSTFGRAITGRSYALASVLYPLRFTHDNVSGPLVTRINCLYRNFVLNHKINIPTHLGSECYRMSVQDAALHPKYGGLGLLDLPTYLSSLRFKTLLQLLLTSSCNAMYLLKALCNSCTQPFCLGIHALFMNHPYVTRMLKCSPCLTALRHYATSQGLYRVTPHITRVIAMKEPIFFNPSVNLDHHDFTNSSSALMSYKRIAQAGFTHVAHFLRQDYSIVKQQWHNQLPRIRNSDHKLHAIMAALLHFNLPDNPFQLQQPPVSTQLFDIISTWLDTWALAQGDSHTLSKVTTKSLYTYAVLRSKPAKPRCIREWEYLHLPTAIMQTRYSWFKHIWHMHLPRKWTDTLYAVLNNSLPTYNKVTRRAVYNSCPLCHQGPDSPDHILFDCIEVKSVWEWAQQVYAFWQPHAHIMQDPISFHLWLCISLESRALPDQWKWFFWCIPVLRALWFSRNSKVYQQHAWSIADIKQYCRAQWLSASLLMSQHYPTNAFQPLITIGPQVHTVHWCMNG